MVNKPLKTILVEDELRGRNALRALVSRVPNLLLVGEAGNVDEASSLIHELEPDLVLLDIEMPAKSGFDLLADLPNRTFDVIFTTAFDNYAIRAIKFSAIDYLLKPVDLDELIAAVNKTAEKRQQSDHQPQLQISNLLENLKSINKRNIKLSLPTSDGSLFIPVDEIIRCESDANYTRFFLKNETRPVLVSRTLKDYEELLKDYEFCRVHHSHLINLKFIKKYIKGEGGVIVMADGAEVEVSRRKKDAFQQALNRFAGII